MLLAIDAGNTNIVFALLEGAKLVASWRSSTNAKHTADEYTAFLTTLMQGVGIDAKKITAAIIGSVVPDANFPLIKLCRDHFKCEPLIVGSPQVDVGLKILLDRPEEIGADRIMNSVSAVATYSAPLIVIDFGTATTFDVVDENGNYAGGAIAPGINLSLHALHMAAAKLPRVSIAPSKKVIGKNTNEAIQSGIFWGYASLIEGMVTRIKQEYGKPMKVVATGGLSQLFQNVVTSIDHFDADLTLRGLQIIFERNKKKQ